MYRRALDAEEGRRAGLSARGGGQELEGYFAARATELSPSPENLPVETRGLLSDRARARARIHDSRAGRARGALHTRTIIIMHRVPVSGVPDPGGNLLLLPAGRGRADAP